VAGDSISPRQGIPDGIACTYLEHELDGVHSRCVNRLNEGWDRINSAISEELLEAYNEEWRQEGPALSSEAFLARLTLPAINVYEEELIVMYFDDDRMFGGHCIDVSYDDDGSIHVTLAG
jgi:hypothetical protein